MTMTTTSPREVAQDWAIDAQLPERPGRRRFTREYKRAVLAEYDALADVGAKGALLRREGLHTSHLAEWRRIAREEGDKDAPRRSPAVHPSGERHELERLRRRTTRLEAELASHKLALARLGNFAERRHLYLFQGGSVMLPESIADIAARWASTTPGPTRSVIWRWPAASSTAASATRAASPCGSLRPGARRRTSARSR